MRLVLRCMLSLVGASFAMSGGGAMADIPEMSLARMEEVSSHIFTGKVVRIYSTVDRSNSAKENTYSVAEISLTRVEKGKHAGTLAYVRFFTQRPAGSQAPPGGSGHRGIPKEGETTRVFVTVAEDGGYDVLPPNGFTPATKP